jgi:hypothetical protein
MKCLRFSAPDTLVLAFFWALISLFPPSVAAADVTLEQVARVSRPNNDFIHVQLYGSYLYAGTFSSGWYVIDVSDPAAPVVVKTNNAIGEREVWGMKVTDTGALVTSHGSTASVYDLSNPSAPASVSSSRGTFGTYTRDAEIFESILIPGDRGLTWYRSGTALSSPAFNKQVMDMQASGEYLYAAGGALFVVEKSGSVLTAVRTIVAGTGVGVRISDATLFLTTTAGLRVFDITDPLNIRIFSSFWGSGMNGTEVAGSYAYIASGASNGVQVVDWSDRRNMKLAGSFNTAGDCHELCVSGDYIYVADGVNGIVVLKQSVAPPSPVLTIRSSPPPSLVLRTGETMTLAVEATSSAPISYRWSASEIFSEAGPSFTITNVNRSHFGVYTVQVTDGTSTETFQTTVRVIGNLQTTFVPSSIPPMISVTDPNGVLDVRYLILERSTNLTDWGPILNSPFTSDPPGAVIGVGNDPAVPSLFYRVMEGEEPFF